MDGRYKCSVDIFYIIHWVEMGICYINLPVIVIW